MAFTIDQPGNRSKQTVPGVAALTHEFAVSGSSNRITTSGYAYDPPSPQALERGPRRADDGRAGETCQYDPPSRCRGGEPTATLHARRGFSAVALAKEEEYKQGATYPWDSVQIHFNGKLAAVNSVADGLLWTHLDHLGSPRIKTDSTGLVPLKLGVPDRDWYYPYGEQINTPVDAVTRRFTGQERDFGSGLDYFGARHYSPSLGRFLSVDPSRRSSDPMDPQTWNRFAYVRNNPLTYVDPNGRELKLAVYNSSSLTKAQAEHVARLVASKYQNAGVKNVTFEVRQGMPSVLTGLLYELGPTPHSHLLELRPSRSGTPTIPKKRVGQNWKGHSAVDTSPVAQQAVNEESKMITGVANIGAHEVGHDTFWMHPGSPATEDLMRAGAAKDKSWLFDPNLQFTPEQAEALRRHYNRSGEVETIDRQKDPGKNEGN